MRRCIFAPPFKGIMKKVISKPHFILAAIIVLLLTAAAIFFPFTGNSLTANASDNSYGGEYSFYYEEFNVDYSIKSNREIRIREELTVHFTGLRSTGFMRDIPVNAGELVRNIKVSEIKDGQSVSVDYSVEDYSDVNNTEYITVDIGDRTNKTKKIHTYILEYTYCLTKAQEGENKLILNVIGPQDRKVISADVKITVPEGFVKGQYGVGKVGSGDIDMLPEISEENGLTVLKTKGIELLYNEGITFDLEFKPGALSTYTDFTPYIFIIVAAVILLILVAVKFLMFNRRNLTPVVNFEAPEKLDPLMMGKLIDNTVDQEDISSMIFYWADKGYLKINLDDEKNPALIRIVKELPENSPSYEKFLFNDLFAGRDLINPKNVPKDFYNTVASVKAVINGKTKVLYEKASKIASIIFAALAGIILAATPFIIGITQINLSYIQFMQISAVILIPVIYALSTTLKNYTHKYKMNSKLIYIAILAGLIVIMFFVYWLFTPSAVVGTIPKVLLTLIAGITAALAPTLLTRTEKYNAQLGEILGFKNFISLAEKDRLEKMIETDPQFYYHILPYAQVLGVSDVWEEKFASITMPPPSYVVYSGAYRVMEFHMINRILRNSAASYASHMAPPRNSSSGGSGRGGFGGHIGGGHGGGGSRGR